MNETYERIYEAVRRVPYGRVATYGQIAVIAGIPRQPRRVGYALHALPDGRSIPWYRIINAKGQISIRSEPGIEKVQRALLEQEGIAFDASGRISFERFGWQASDGRHS